MNRIAITLTLLLCSLSAHAGVEISAAWARATAPGQEVGAAYMRLKSSGAAKLIKVASAAAGTVEIHEMSMNGGVMKMRMLDELNLPAGKSVALEPGGFHLMLIDLKKPLKAGDHIDISLTLKDSRGKLSSQKVSLPVKTD
jgi:copper(I)-binding protein